MIRGTRQAPTTRPNDPDRNHFNNAETGTRRSWLKLRRHLSQKFTLEKSEAAENEGKLSRRLTAILRLLRQAKIKISRTQKGCRNTEPHLIHELIVERKRICNC
jgi:hypothetical protein